MNLNSPAGFQRKKYFMVKKTKSFADKIGGKEKEADSVHVKYVKSIRSEKTGHWRFNEKMIAMNDGEDLDTALNRMDETAEMMVDISMPDTAEEGVQTTADEEE